MLASVPEQVVGASHVETIWESRFGKRGIKARKDRGWAEAEKEGRVRKWCEKREMSGNWASAIRMKRGRCEGTLSKKG